MRGKSKISVKGLLLYLPVLKKSSITSSMLFSNNITCCYVDNLNCKDHSHSIITCLITESTLRHHLF